MLEHCKIKRSDHALSSRDNLSQAQKITQQRPPQQQQLRLSVRYPAESAGSGRVHDGQSDVHRALHDHWRVVQVVVVALPPRSFRRALPIDGLLLLVLFLPLLCVIVGRCGGGGGGAAHGLGATFAAAAVLGPPAHRRLTVRRTGIATTTTTTHRCCCCCC